MKIHFLSRNGLWLQADAYFGEPVISASRRHYRRSRLFITAFIVFSVMGRTVAGQAENNPEQRFAAPPQNEIKIISTEFKFAVPAHRIAAARPVTLILDNSQAESEHAIFFQALGVRVFARAGEIVHKTVIFDKAAEYSFVCDLPGHREAGMIGKLAVRAADKSTSPEILGSDLK
jgi:plastocyanin